MTRDAPASARTAAGVAPRGPLGAHVEDGATRFAALTTARTCGVRLLAPGGAPVATHEMASAGDGHFEARVEGVGHGALYEFVLDGARFPDPYARYLPLGVHGPAMVVEPRHTWRHEHVSRPLREHVIYELHIGTFTEYGTYSAATARLPELCELGVTAIELMPISSFPGERGWGYDGVAHYAPFAPYGSPDDLRRFVDDAHGLGLSVLLDVVYNHFGPSGNYLGSYCPEYFTDEVRTAWGNGPRFTFPAMRRHVIENALYWLTEFRFDGLRLDAIHAIVDPSPRHVLRELADEVAKLSPRRLLVAEDERNDPASVTELALDAVWADDFHHQVHVTLTGEKDGYYSAYQPGAQGIAEAIYRGWIYEGQFYLPWGGPRGKPAPELGAEHLVYAVQNHDQVGNRALGQRLSSLVSLDAYCAASALLLFLPMTPLLFMGQEWAASSPFLYFTDHDEELGRLVSEGRREEFKHFAAFSDPAERSRIPDPQAFETFAASRLRWDERDGPGHRRVLSLYRTLLALRRTDPVLREAGREGLFAEALGDVLVVRRILGTERRFLIVNFGDAPVSLKGVLPQAAALRQLAASREGIGGDVLPPECAVVLADGG